MRSKYIASALVTATGTREPESIPGNQRSLLLTLSAVALVLLSFCCEGQRSIKGDGWGRVGRRMYVRAMCVCACNAVNISFPRKKKGGLGRTYVDEMMIMMMQLRG
ncbi:unnamed protein product [Ectocarpus sp. 4 AP-2014]